MGFEFGGLTWRLKIQQWILRLLNFPASWAIYFTSLSLSFPVYKMWVNTKKSKPSSRHMVAFNNPSLKPPNCLSFLICGWEDLHFIPPEQEALCGDLWLQHHPSQLTLATHKSLAWAGWQLTITWAYEIAWWERGWQQEPALTPLRHASCVSGWMLTTTPPLCMTPVPGPGGHVSQDSCPFFRDLF